MTSQFCHNFVTDIEDDHLLNATYYSPEAEDRHLLEHSSTNLGMMVHNESPTHMDTASSAGMETSINDVTLFSRQR